MWPLSQSEPFVGSVILGRCGQIQGALLEPLTPHLGAPLPAPRQALPWALDSNLSPGSAGLGGRLCALGPERSISGL